MLFKDIPGLTSTKEQLINAVNTGHVAHAQLFVGSEGSGKYGFSTSLRYLFEL